MLKRTASPIFFRAAKRLASSEPDFYWRPSFNEGMSVWTTHMVSVLTGDDFEKKYVHYSENTDGTGSGCSHKAADQFLTAMSTVKTNGMKPACMYGARVNYDDKRNVLNASHYFEESIPYIKIALFIRFPEIYSILKNEINEQRDILDELTQNFLQSIDKERHEKNTTARSKSIFWLAKNYEEKCINVIPLPSARLRSVIQKVGEKCFIEKFSENEIDEINKLVTQLVNSKNDIYSEPDIFEKLQQIRSEERMFKTITPARPSRM